MACSKPKNPNFSILNLEELQHELVRVNLQYRLCNIKDNVTGRYNIAMRLPKCLSHVEPDWKNDEIMTQYVHMNSLITPGTPFQWQHLAPQQFSFLRRWVKGKSHQIFDVFRHEDPDYQEHKIKILEKLFRRPEKQEILNKLHAVGRSKVIARYMELKANVLRFRRQLFFQAGDMPGSSNDPSVLERVTSTARGLFKTLANVPSATLDIARSVREAIKGIATLFSSTVKAAIFVNNYWYRIALGVLYLLAMAYFQSAAATTVLSILTAVCAFMLDDNILVAASLAIGGATLGMQSASRVGTFQTMQPSISAPSTINIHLYDDRKRVIAQSFNPTVIIAFAFSLFASAVCPFDKAWESFYKKCDRLPKTVKGLESTTELFQKYFGDFTDKIVQETTGYKPNELRPIPQEVIDNCNETKELVRLQTYSRMPSDTGICIRIEKAYMEYMRLKTLYYTNKSITEYMSLYQGSLIDLFRRASTSNPGVSSERPKPTCIYFTGTTGVGKTSMIYLLTADILQKYKLLEGKSDEDILKIVNESIYARNASQEFFDGYQNQLVTVVDDFGCMVDGPTHPCKDFEELLHMVNNFPYPLPMASLSQKANTYFTSRFVFLTSNLKELNPTSMINPEAVRSRIAYRFNIKVKPEYQIDPNSTRVEDHRIDVRKTREKFGDNSVVDIYTIECINPVTGRLIDEISYDEMVSRITRHHDGEKNFFDSKQNSILSHLRRNVRAQGFFSTLTGQNTDLIKEDINVEFPNRPYIFDMEKLRSWFGRHEEVDNFIHTFERVRFAGPQHFDHICAKQYLQKVYDTGDVYHLIELDCAARSSILEAELRTPTIRHRDVDGEAVAELVYLDGHPDEYYQSGLWYKKLARDTDSFLTKFGKILRNEEHSVLLDMVKKVIVAVALIMAIQRMITSFWGSEVDVGLPDKQKERAIRRNKKLIQAINNQDISDFSDDETDEELDTMIERIQENNQQISKTEDTNPFAVESGKSKKLVQTRAIESGKSKKLALLRQLESGKSKRLLKNRTVEAFTSVQAQEVSKMVMSHYRDLLIEIDGQKHKLATIVAIRGHWCLMNHHYIHNFKEVMHLEPTQPIIIAASGHTNGTQIPISTLYDGRMVYRAGEPTDMWAFKLPKTANMCGDLIRHFHSRSMMNDVVPGMSAILPIPGKIPVIHTCHLTGRETGAYDVTLSDNTQRTLKCLMYEFDARTSAGDCGSLYIADSNNIRNKIVGFHFAGLTVGGACAMPLIREDFDFLDDEPIVFQSDDVIYGPCDLSRKVDGIIPIGKAKPVHSSIVTTLERTSIFNQIQETTVMPVKLGKLLADDGPGMKAIQKVLPTVPEIPEEELNMAEESFCEVLYTGRRATSRVFDVMEAITGVIPEDEPYVRAINRSTSAGYPWMLRSRRGKKDMFHYDEKTMKWSLKPLGKEVVETVERKVADMKNGKYEHAIYVDTLKDETRPIAKVLANKTRLFSAAPVDYVILFRMYFLAFLNWCMVNRISNEISVGLCAQSTDWNRLANYLRRMGNNLIAGDFSNYDGTLNPGILLRVLKIINKWYGDDNDQIRSFLFEDIIHSVHIAEENVYQWTHSQPSGNPGTAVINSIYNSLACRISYNRLTKGTKYYGRFNEFVRMNSYGDDNLLSIHSDIIDIVNQQTLTEAFATFGMIYTDETKSTTAIKCKSLVECGYLKRGFHFDPKVNLWLAPLNKDSINERLNWQHKSPDPEGILRLNAEGAIAEWALHTDDEFNFWAFKIQDIFLDKGVYIPVYPRSYYTTMLLDSSFNVVFPQLEFAGLPLPPKLLAGTQPRIIAQSMENLIKSQPTSTQPSALNNSPTNPTLIGNPNTETIDTIRFTNEGEAPKHVSSFTKESDKQLKVVNNIEHHQIKNFLERPHRVEGIDTWKTGAYDLMYKINIEGEIQRMLSTYKLYGFYGFKGTCKLRVLVNAQPFHSGLLQIAYLPKYETFPTSALNDQPMGGFYPTGIDSFYLARYESGCPSVLLNLGAASACELKVPYNGAETLMGLDHPMFGEFHIRALVPIADSTNNPACGMSAYISFEDVELYATTPLNDLVSKTVVAQSMDISSIIQALQQMLPNQQAAQTAPPSQSEEAASNSKGVVSGIADTVGNIASKLTSIPGVADVAGPVSWIANGVGSVARMFGFSKPHSDKPSEPVWINPFKDFPLCEGNDNSTKLTVTPKAEIEVRPIGETDKDEMTISHILAKPVAFAGYKWTAEMKAGTPLAAIPINPLNFRDQSPSYKGSFVGMSSHTFVSYIATLFRYWMGTIRLTFTVTGNKFYSGRLRFVYVPEVELAKKDTYAPAIFKDMQHTYTHIVDIRDANTFTVDCAYVSLTPWRKTSYVTSSGVLYVFVEQPLAHPDTVSKNLIIYSHVSGLEDLTFAGPTRPRGTPMMGWDADASHFNIPKKSVVAQGFTVPLSDQQVPTNIPIVNDVSRANPVEAHKSSVGDPVTSLRQLVKRFYINCVMDWNTNTMLLQPFKLTDAQDNPHTIKTNFVSSDMIDYVSFLYRFRKGGVRIACRGFQEDITATHRNISQLKADNTLGLYSSDKLKGTVSPGIARIVDLPKAIQRAETYYAPAYSFIPHKESVQGILQLEVPFYHEYALMENNRFRHLLDRTDTTLPNVFMLVPQDIPNLTTSNVIMLSRATTTAETIEIYRAAADDFNCGFLLGPPPTLDMDKV